MKFAGHLLQILMYRMRQLGSISLLHCWYTEVSLGDCFYWRTLYILGLVEPTMAVSGKPRRRQVACLSARSFHFRCTEHRSGSEQICPPSTAFFGIYYTLNGLTKEC